MGASLASESSYLSEVDCLLPERGGAWREGGGGAVRCGAAGGGFLAL